MGRYDRTKIRMSMGNAMARLPIREPEVRYGEAELRAPGVLTLDHPKAVKACSAPA